jgi:cysteine synthase A
LAGVAQGLKQYSNEIKVFLADPPGSVLYSLKTVGKLERTGDGSITEGIGQGRVTANLEPSFSMLDGAIHVPDSETIDMVFRLLHEEGLLVGASSALNVVAACKLAERLGPGKKIVTILCDGGGRYASRLFSRSWIELKGFNIPPKYQKYLSRE